jgi:multicomponent Na+:H+ antiporter subunit E
MITVNANQRTPLGRVIYANSITLTPGTVSVEMLGDQIRVHALSLEEAADDMSGDMNDRVCRLEKTTDNEPQKDV